MKAQLLLLMVLVSSLYSCTRSRYATVGAYESDDAYYTESDTYIADFALVDDEAQMAAAADSSSTTSSSDDYYDPNYSSPAVSSPNNYANNWTPDPWNSGYNSCGNSFGSGFGNYNYGNYWNNSPYVMPSIGWNPYSGYYTNFTFVYGYNSFYNPYCSPSFGYNPYSSWFTPYYTPYYYSGWAYNPWNSPFNYYNAGGNDSGNGSSIVHGPRNPISTISAANSSYSSQLFYNGTKRDVHAYVNEIESAQKPIPTAATTIKQPAAGKPANAFEVRPSTKPTTQRPTYTPSKPARDRDAVKPGLNKPRETAPNRDQVKPVSPKPPSGRGYTPPTNAPTRDRKPPLQTEPSTRPREEAPTRETPRSSPRTESTPSRNSGTATPQTRSGGGSTNSPRRK